MYTMKNANIQDENNLNLSFLLILLNGALIVIKIRFYIWQQFNLKMSYKFP